MGFEIGGAGQALSSDCGTKTMEGEKEDVVAFAKTASGPVFCDPGSTLTSCYGCGHELSWVKPFERKLNGILHPVKGHFRHKKRVPGPGCDGETREHKAAKDAIAKGCDWEYFVPCADCRTEIEVEVVAPRGKPPEAKVECPFRDYVLDVGYRADDGVVGAVEIMQTHAIPEDKANELTGSGIAWVEVSATEVLDAFKNRRSRLRGLRCAVLKCGACVEKDIEKERLSALAKQRADAEAQRRVRAALKNEGLYTHMSQEDQIDASLGTFWKGIVASAAATLDPGELESLTRSLAGATNKVAADNDQIELERCSKVILFGKYTGRRVVDVFKEDPAYTRFLADYSGFRDGTKPKPSNHEYSCSVPTMVKKEARALLKGHCLLCFEDTGAGWKHWCGDCFRRAG